MNDKICYISYEDVLKVYRKMIDASDGGFAGVRDEGGILATLDFVQSDIYYPTFAEKLCYLVFQFCSGHYFNDGNKRIALTLGAYFLHQNHCPWFSCVNLKLSFIKWRLQTLIKRCFCVSWLLSLHVRIMTKH